MGRGRSGTSAQSFVLCFSVFSGDFLLQISQKFLSETAPPMQAFSGKPPREKPQNAAADGSGNHRGSLLFPARSMKRLSTLSSVSAPSRFAGFCCQSLWAAFLLLIRGPGNPRGCRKKRGKLHTISELQTHDRICTAPFE